MGATRMIGDDIVADAIEETIGRGEVGLQVAAYFGGELVVDAWGGHRNLDGDLVNRNTIFWAASAGKASTATGIQAMVERGQVSYDDRISDIWPEFAQAGKDRFTVGDAITHRIGLAALPEGTTQERLGDWDWMTAQLAAAKPALEPGLLSAYHPMTWGYVVGEIMQRRDPQGRDFDRIMREEVLGPFGIDELWHHFPASEAHRVASITGVLVRAGRPDLVIEPDDERNSPEFWQRVSPSGAMMTARAGARLFALYAHGGQIDGRRLLDGERVRSFLRPRPDALIPDRTAGRIRAIGMGGLWLGGQAPGAEEIVGFGNDVLWHPGGGGTVAFADTDADLAVVICHNRFYDWEGLSLAEHPFTPIVKAVYNEFVGASEGVSPASRRNAAARR